MKKKTTPISRMKHRIAIVSMFAYIILFLLGAKFKSMPCVLAGFVFVLICLVIIRTENRCPECGERFKGLYWSKPAGRCKECGALLRFDDEE